MRAGIFLGRLGKIYGPYSKQEFERFHESGKIYEFTWIWDDTNNGWKSLDPAPSFVPPSLEEKEVHAEIEEDQEHENVLPISAGSVSAKKIPGRRITNSGYQALCHNFRYAVSGEVNSMTETSCELKIDLESGKTFPKNTNLLLNIYDPKTGKTVNVKARLIDSVREGNGWLYHMRWDSRPEFEKKRSI